ncbi:MAG: hypothetical protein WD273_06460 [Trueperaceae bacterium]
MTTTRLAGSLIIRVYQRDGQLSIAVHQLRRGEVQTFRSWEEVVAHLQTLYRRGLR